jgi:hypothetical protein
MCGEQPIILYNHQTVLLNRTTFLILGGGGNCFSFGRMKFLNKSEDLFVFFRCAYQSTNAS